MGKTVQLGCVILFLTVHSFFTQLSVTELTFGHFDIPKLKMSSYDKVQPFNIQHHTFTSRN